MTTGRRLLRRIYPLQGFNPFKATLRFKKASFFAPKNAWKLAGFIGSRQAYDYWQEAPSHKHAVSQEISRR